MKIKGGKDNKYIVYNHYHYLKKNVMLHIFICNEYACIHFFKDINIFIFARMHKINQKWKRMISKGWCDTED